MPKPIAYNCPQPDISEDFQQATQQLNATHVPLWFIGFPTPTGLEDWGYNWTLTSEIIGRAAGEGLYVMLRYDPYRLTDNWTAVFTVKDATTKAWRADNDTPYGAVYLACKSALEERNA